MRGGASRDRTDDLYNAIVALSQLSYSPTREKRNVRDGCTVRQPLVTIFLRLRINFFAIRPRVATGYPGRQHAGFYPSRLPSRQREPACTRFARRRTATETIG